MDKADTKAVIWQALRPYHRRFARFRRELAAVKLPAAQVRQHFLDAWDGLDNGRDLKIGAKHYRNLERYKRAHMTGDGQQLSLRSQLEIQAREAAYRPFLLRAALQGIDLEAVTAVAEFYHGAFLTGPQLFHSVPYIQVSNEPAGVGLETLPADFLRRIGLPSLVNLNLAHFLPFLESAERQSLALLQQQALPDLHQFPLPDHAFAHRKDVQGLFSLYLELNWGRTPGWMQEAIVKKGGWMVFLYRQGLANDQLGGESARVSKQSKYIDDISGDNTAYINDLPAFRRSDFVVSIYRKV